MKRLFPLLVFLIFSYALFSQTSSLQRPKLVIGVVIDQMRWDYIYRYYDRYSEGGFKRILGEGFSCENTMIPYAQTVTAAGHSCVYTGSVPAINGIMGNEWFDRSLDRPVYCTEDDSVRVIGGSPDAAPESPRNLWTTTICDELRLATNFRSKVIGIAIKDRGGILTAGHSANGAFWYDAISGNWVTSTYYMNDLPAWVKKFNARKIVDSLYKLGWNTLYPIDSYIQSDQDDEPYEGKYPQEEKPVFPHKFDSYAGKSYGMIVATPYGNTMTFSFTKSAIDNEALGVDDITDFLALSLSSPDYIGHQFGPNSIEEEDVYLRLDRELADFLTYLDNKVGKNQYLFFLTADHGVAHVPGFLRSKKMPAEIVSLYSMPAFTSTIRKFAIPNLYKSMDNYQVYLNHEAIDSAGLRLEDVKQFVISEFNKEPEVLLAFDNEKINSVNLPENVREMFINGYNAKRGGDVQIIFKSGNFSGFATGTSHGTWYPYDAHIPLLWMGWGVKPGKSNKTVFMTDIAPTIAALLHIQMPSGSIGKVIREVME